MIAAKDRTPLKIGLLLAGLVTGIIHIAIGEPLLILNGIGYLALLVLFFFPRFGRWREPVRWTLVGYTAVTIVLYFVFHPNGAWQQDGFGLLTKMVEVILVLLLIADTQLGGGGDG